MQLYLVLEAILFKSVKPLSADELLQVVRRTMRGRQEGEVELSEEEKGWLKIDADDVRKGIDELDEVLKTTSMMVQEVGDAYRLVTRPEYGEFIQQLLGEAKPQKLSPAALETLAVIAYRQPISRAEIEGIRGVAVGGVLETLIDRGIIQVAGRADVPGKPLIYETSVQFLEHFGLRSIEDLPNLEELRRVGIPEVPDAGSEGQPELINESTGNQREN